MISETMKVAIEFAAVDGVTGFLNVLNGRLGLTNMKVGQLNSSLGRLAVGAAAAGAGLLILSSFKAPIEEAKKFQVELAKLAQFGMSDVANADAEKFVRAQKIMGNSTRELMHYFVEAQGIFRGAGLTDPVKMLEGAKILSPILGKIHFAQSALGRGEMTDTDDRNMLRFIEDRGGATDPKKALRIAEMGYKLINSSGGQVRWSDLQQLMAGSGPIGFTLSDRGVAELEPLLAAQGGAAVASALQSTNRRIEGAGATMMLSRRFVSEAVSLGLWDKNDLEFNKSGGLKNILRNPFTTRDLFQQSPTEWYSGVFLPAIAKKYGNWILGNDQHAKSARADEINVILGSSQKGGSIFTRMDQMLPNIALSVNNQAKSLGIDSSYKLAQSTYSGQQQILSANWHNFLLQVGQVALPAATQGLKLLNSVLVGIGNFATQHAALFKILVSAFFGLGVALTVIGGVIIGGFLISAFGAVAAGIGGIGAVAIWAFPLIAGLAGGIAAFVAMITGKPITPPALVKAGAPNDRYSQLIADAAKQVQAGNFAQAGADYKAAFAISNAAEKQSGAAEKLSGAAGNLNKSANSITAKAKAEQVARHNAAIHNENQFRLAQYAAEDKAAQLRRKAIAEDQEATRLRKVEFDHSPLGRLNTLGNNFLDWASAETELTGEKAENLRKKREEEAQKARAVAEKLDAPNRAYLGQLRKDGGQQRYAADYQLAAKSKWAAPIVGFGYLIQGALQTLSNAIRDDTANLQSQKASLDKLLATPPKPPVTNVSVYIDSKNMPARTVINSSSGPSGPALNRAPPLRNGNMAARPHA